MTTLRTASDALTYVEASKHFERHLKRGIDYHTYVHWYDDERLALRYHATDIVTFDAEGLTLDFDGWRTITTFARAEAYTHVRFFQSNGLHFIPQDEGPPVLFTDGLRVAPDGTVLNPLPSAHEQGIKDAVFSLPKRIRRWCMKTARAWDSFEEIGCDECPGNFNSQASAPHMLEHVEQGTPANLLLTLDERAKRAPHYEGDTLVRAQASALYRDIRKPLMTAAIERVRHDFKWVPNERRRAHALPF